MQDLLQLVGANCTFFNVEFLQLGGIFVQSETAIQVQKRPFLPHPFLLFSQG